MLRKRDKYTSYPHGWPTSKLPYKAIEWGVAFLPSKMMMGWWWLNIMLTARRSLMILTHQQAVTLCAKPTHCYRRGVKSNCWVTNESWICRECNGACKIFTHAWDSAPEHDYWTKKSCNLHKYKTSTRPCSEVLLLLVYMNKDCINHRWWYSLSIFPSMSEPHFHNLIPTELGMLFSNIRALLLSTLDHLHPRLISWTQLGKLC